MAVPENAWYETGNSLSQMKATGRAPFQIDTTLAALEESSANTKLKNMQEASRESIAQQNVDISRGTLGMNMAGQAQTESAEKMALGTYGAIELGKMAITPQDKLQSSVGGALVKGAYDKVSGMFGGTKNVVSPTGTASTSIPSPGTPGTEIPTGINPPDTMGGLGPGTEGGIEAVGQEIGFGEGVETGGGLVADAAAPYGLLNASSGFDAMSMGGAGTAGVDIGFSQALGSAASSIYESIAAGLGEIASGFAKGAAL
jgi:hypothetical protein